MGLGAIGLVLAVVAGVAILGFWVAFAITLTLVVRGVRRGCRRMSGRVPRTSRATAETSRPDVRAFGGLTAATVASPAWWSVQHDRHRMWRSVTAADHAVRVAQEAGAPVGDLPALARQLTNAARGIDAVLRASGGGRGSEPGVAAERERIEAAAADVQRAAVDSLKVMVEGDTDPLITKVQLEVAALAAGVRSARYQPRS